LRVASTIQSGVVPPHSKWQLTQLSHRFTARGVAMIFFRRDDEDSQKWTIGASSSAVAAPMRALKFRAARRNSCPLAKRKRAAHNVQPWSPRMSAESPKARAGILCDLAKGVTMV